MKVQYYSAIPVAQRAASAAAERPTAWAAAAAHRAPEDESIPAPESAALPMAESPEKVRAVMLENLGELR